MRSAGFPAETLLPLCDTRVAAAADAQTAEGHQVGEDYAEAFADAVAATTAAVRTTAADPTFREAVTWQNPALVPRCLDLVVAGERRNARGRGHELAVVSYLQRYAVKNETIGFFGPVGWARLDDHAGHLSVVAGPGLTATRTTYFETWAIDALAEALAADPGVRPWLAPRVARGCAVGRGSVRIPLRRPLPLTAVASEVLERCDGQTTVGEIVGVPPDPHRSSALAHLRDAGVLEIDLKYPVTCTPERGLADRVAAIAEPVAKARAAAPLDALLAARDQVAASAGDATALGHALDDLKTVFEHATGRQAARNPGQTNAGRTPVYEDTVRAVEIGIGAGMVERIAAPLTLLLDSASWLANTVAARYLERATLQWRREQSRHDGTGVPLLRLLSAVMPEVLFPAAPVRSAVVEDVVAGFQERWKRIIDLRPVPGHHLVASAAVAAAVAREFPATPARWTGARRHSPDLMVAADGPAAAAAGDYDVVLGELHVAAATVENRLFVAQHPDPARLRSAAEADGLHGRVVAMPRRDVPSLSTRLSRSEEVMLPSTTYVSVGSESMAVPDGAAVLPAADLVVESAGSGLAVRHRRDGRILDFLEVVGDLLTMLCVDAFALFAPAPYRPRVSIDRLVVARETWVFPATDLAWAFNGDEAGRYAAARRWRCANGLPERAFLRVPVERKPSAVDFRSPALVALLAKSVRRTAEAGGRVTLSEMLPGTDRLWLVDGQGRRYTSELRFTAVRG